MLCVFIDAWNPEYLKYMPFIDSIRKNSRHGYLEVPLGYTGIIASFMTGVWPDKHGIFDLFVPDLYYKKKIKSKWLLGAIRYLQGKRVFFTPPKAGQMGFFRTSMDKSWAQKGCLNYKTIFDVLEENNQSFELIDWPNHFKNRKGNFFFSKECRKSYELAMKSKADFIFVHFLDLEIAHQTGIRGREIKKNAKIIDKAVEKLCNKHKNVLLFSDHGMDNIQKEVNILKELKKLDLKYGRDFIYIVGSTSAEFWFKNKEAEKKVKEFLEWKDYGHIVEQKKFHLKTGSLIFLANFRTGFYPNFFSNKKFKAMHGWDPKEQKTYYVLKNEKARGKKDAKIVDFFPTIIDLMDLKFDGKIDGKSLV